MPTPVTSKIADTVRNVTSAVRATARQVPKRRMVMTTAVIAAVVAVRC